MKKTLIIVLALIMILALGAGCANANADNNEANGAGVTAEDESLRGSGNAFETAAAVMAGNVSIEQINIFDADDDASFRTGAAWSNMDLTAVSGN